MKKLVLFALSAVLTVGLSARENPFEATNAYEEEAAKIVELSEAKTQESIQEANYISEMQKKMDQAATKSREEDKKSELKIEKKVEKKVQEQKKPKSEKVYTKKEVDRLIKKTEIKTQEIIKKELENTKPVEVVYVKPRTDIGQEEKAVKTEDGMKKKQVLPFVELVYNDDKLVINTKYSVSKKFTTDKDNKLVMDFKARVNFPTLKEEINTKNFKVVSFGNHEKEGFFRMVIQFTENPSKYNSEFKEDGITITKK